MTRLLLGSIFVLCVGCASTPLGAHREAQRAYQDCVEINGESRCERERAAMERRARELQERDLNQGPRPLDRY